MRPIGRGASATEGSPHILRTGSEPSGDRSLSLFLALFLAFAFAAVSLPPPLARADEASTTTGLEVGRFVAEAERLGLAESRAWLRLGEWRPRLLGRGVVSDADGSGFFLSPDGRHEPESELRATLAAVLLPFAPGDDGSSHAQCLFPARSRFLFDSLGLEAKGVARHPCPRLAEWKRKLDAEAVSLVFASSYMNNAASMFGHTFLRFHSRSNRDGRELLDYGVSFFANTGRDGGVPFALYGLAGKYPGYFSLAPYHETLKEYANLEGRDVFEYELALSPAEVERLVERLLELERTHFDYWFLDENCSYRLLAALEAARPDLDLLSGFLYEVIPADSVRAVTAAPGLVRAIRYRPSLTTKFRASVAALDDSERAWVTKLARASAPELASARSELDRSRLPVRRAAILDATLPYVDVGSARDPEAARERAFQLRTWRASLAMPSEVPEPAPPPRPEEGHDPAFLAAGFGQRDGRSYQDAQFRFAYHDLLSHAAGYLDDTQLEVLRVRARFYEEASAPRLEELQVLDLISLQPSDRFFRPPAWRVRLGLERPPDRPLVDGLAFALGGGPGFALEPWAGRLLVFSFVQAHAEASRDFHAGHRLGASARLEALAHPWPRLRLLAGIEERRDFSGDPATRSSVWTRAAFTLSRNLETRASWSRTGDVHDHRFELVAFFRL